MRTPNRNPNGFIYFIQAAAGAIKIGHAVNPLQRLGTLQIAHYEPLTLLGVIPGTLNDEEEIHGRLAASHIRGEWHRPTLDVLNFVAKTIPAPPVAKIRSACITAPRQAIEIENALATTKGDISKAAVVLGCSRRTLQNRMRELHMPAGKPGRRAKEVGLTPPKG